MGRRENPPCPANIQGTLFLHEQRLPADCTLPPVPPPPLPPPATVLMVTGMLACPPTEFHTVTDVGGVNCLVIARKQADIISL